MPPRTPFLLTPLALAVLMLAGTVQAQKPEPATAAAAPAEAGAAVPPADGLRLRPSVGLRETLPADAHGQRPTFMRADMVRGQAERQITLEGAAELRRGDSVIRADRIDYQQPSDLARATGKVLVNQAGNRFEGPRLELRVDAFEGFFEAPRFELLRNQAHGSAERVDFIDERRAIIRGASYSTCRRDGLPDWMPDWVLRASSLRIDQDAEIGEAEDAQLSFMGVSLPALPGISFPLTDRRKSGWLPPTLGLDSISGLELTVPYYLNLAPNRDATLLPTVMTKRGVNLGAELRYLEARHRGQAQLNWMPNDRLRGRDRWGLALGHDGSWPAWQGALGLYLNHNRVSDDNYWRDFSRSGSSLTQRLLPSDLLATWQRGPLTLMARRLSWQTLQDPGSPIVPPYDRAPQLQAVYDTDHLPAGLRMRLEADHTHFRSVRALTGQPDGRRTYLLAQLTRPWQLPGGYITPRLQWHETRYQLDTPLAGGAREARRGVPTFSVDAGLVFERDARLFGRDWQQTLEPRVFYVHTPYRDQSLLPNYDSAANDFNFATIFTENAFGGHDRIADSRLLTLGATTRLLEPATGAEVARFALAQRLRYADQRVTLPGQPPVTDRLSDLLAGAAFTLDDRWAVESTLQFNPKTRRSVRATAGARYTPGPYRVLNMAYRLQRGSSEQLDLGWQWPLSLQPADLTAAPGGGLGAGRWYSVGRLNLSLKDRRLVDSVLGLEYDGGCWVGRIVFERLQSGSTSSSKRVLFQLEFIGLARLGTNALGALRENIPRYQMLRDRSPLPSRFSQYD